MLKMMLAAACALLLVACKDEPDPNLVRVSGHVEATDVRVAPEVGGRIVSLAVKEGDRVEAGNIVLRLDTRDAQLAIDRARAEQRAAEAQLALLRAGSRPEEIRQSDAQAQAARDEAQAARAELAAAEADLQRFEALLEANAGSRKQRDDARTRRDVARERVQASDSRLRAAEQGTVKLRSGARPQEIDAARARVAAAVTQVATAEELLKDAEVISPARGIVSEKLAEVGEVIAPRTPVLVITDLDNAWADVYVPEPVVPRLRLGQAATIFTDAGGSGLQGSLTYISPKAEFTPRNVQTAEERAKLVYRVRLTIDNKEGVLKSGMPVEAEIPLAPLDSAQGKPVS
jgi:HlyD family secretion protein